jgi:endonuclease/exonuclease/phosphatase (EEP) superfamily protein YafD
MTTAEKENSTTVPPNAARSAWRSLLTRCAIAGAILILAGMGSATIAGFFGRSHWRLELLGHFRVQYFWGLTLAAATLLLARRWFLGASGVLLAAVNLGLIAPLYFGSDGLTGATPQLKLFSLNVHFLNRDFQPTLDVIADEQPDVILLMEITPDWADALDSLKPLYPHAHVKPSHRTDGMALFSRYPIRKLDVKRCPGINLPTLLAEIELPGGPVTVVGTHPASPGTADLFEARNIQLAMVGDWVAQRAGPTVLLGDLNTTSWSPYFKDLLSASGLRDSRYGYGVEPTWPWFPLPLRIPIDHCLVSPHFGVISRRVGPNVQSDHRPILVELVY